MSSIRFRFFIPLIFLIGFLIYGSVLSAPFQFDDIPVIAKYEPIRDANPFHLWSSVRHPARYVAYLTFAWNYHFHQLDPFGYRLVNVILHCLNSVMVFMIVRLLLRAPNLKFLSLQTKTRFLPEITSLLFLIHPIQTQAVTYITQRFTSLAAFFYLGAVLFFLLARGRKKKNRSRKVFYGVAILAGVLAMFTKQISLTLPVMIGLIVYFFFPPREKGFKRRILLTGILIGGVLVIPAMYGFSAGKIFSMHTVSGSHPGDPINWLTYSATQPRVIATYFRLLILPIKQNLLYDFPTTKSFLDEQTVLALAALGVLMFIAFRLRRSNPLVSFGIAWFLVALSVESSFIPIRHVIFEHRSYLPSVGIFLVMAFCISILLRKDRRYYLLLGALFLIFFVAAIFRNAVWKDPVILWRDVVKKSPRHPKAHYNLGYVLMKKGEYEQALEHYSKAISLRPGYKYAFFNRSQIFIDLGQYDLAMADLNRAISLHSQWSEAYSNRGVLHLKLGHQKKALEDLNKAIIYDADSKFAYLNRAVILADMGIIDLALKDFEEVLRRHPNSFEAYYRRAMVYLSVHQQDQALADFSRVIELSPEHVGALKARASILEAQEKYQEAVGDINRVIELTSQPWDGLSKRAYLYNKLGLDDMALKDYDSLLEYKPHLSQVYIEKGKILYQKSYPQQAEEQYNKALEYDEDNGETFFLRALVLYDLERYAEASEDLFKAKELGFPVSDVYFKKVQSVLKK